MAVDLPRLTDKFRKQHAFTAGYSPLYACLFGAVAGWLAENPDDPLVTWLLAAGDGRNTFDIPLLLAAGLHRDILAGVAAVTPLARYYPTAGGDLACDNTDGAATADFAAALHQAILSRRDSLATFMQTANVQTNETGRGLAWVLPLRAVNWLAVHLVDLGASAGLNLVADERAYHLVDAANGHFLLDIGRAEPVQFVTRCRGEFNDLLANDQADGLPGIASRTGCDITPFALETADDEQTLAAFIWGDQPHRLQRLREGIAAFRRVNQGRAPVRLYPAALPEELPVFLDQHIPTRPDLPVIIYNTYITMYLPDKGAALPLYVAAWAVRQTRPVLWLQWEVVRSSSGSDPPALGWCAWTADLWHGQDHRQWRLGRVHPHGTDVQWEPGIKAWTAYWRS